MFSLRSRTPVSCPARKHPAPWIWVGIALACGLWSGCQAVTNPVAEGIPVRRLPPEFLGRPREVDRPIPLALLGQRRPEEYLVGPGDVLGIWIEGVLGEPGVVPPVVQQVESLRAPALGYPVPVGAEGNLSLPYVPPIPVKGLTLTQVRQAIFDAYTRKSQVLKTGKERIFVTLMSPRRYHVLVVREDTGALTFGGASPTQAGGGGFGNAKRGTGYTLELAAYENDVLNALTRTGGLPGLDATNEVFIERETRNQPGAAVATGSGCPPGGIAAAAAANKQIVRIPLRLPDGAPVPFTPEDVILGEGDIVRILARDRELFYTAGILPPGEHILPRDYDLDVLAACLQIGGTLFNGFQAQGALTGTTTSSMLGDVNPSQLSVIRRTSDGRQVVILVDLNRAAQDRRERILVQPGDVLVLQQTVGEAILSYLVPKFSFSLSGRPLKTTNPAISTGLTLP